MQLTGRDASGEIEGREHRAGLTHHAGLSISVTSACVMRRANGMAK
jgi:hypothetical protein